MMVLRVGAAAFLTPCVDGTPLPHVSHQERFVDTQPAQAVEARQSHLKANSHTLDGAANSPRQVARQQPALQCGAFSILEVLP